MADSTGTATVALWGEPARCAKHKQVFEMSKVRVRFFDNDEKKLTTTRNSTIQVDRFCQSSSPFTAMKQK